MARHRTFRPALWMLLTTLALPLPAQRDRREEGRPERPREQVRERPREARRESPHESRREPRIDRRDAHPAQARPSQPGGPPEGLERGRMGRSRNPGEGPSREAARTWQVREPWRRDAWGVRRDWQGHRARHWEREHLTWAQRGGYGGYRIPEAQFVSTFGPSHPFRLGSRPVIHRGYPRLHCGGYWFLIVDPWPEFWLDDWYLTDAIYIDYHLDGYYLFNPRYPGIRVAITVFL